ncbi:penicillin-binding protein [Anaerobacillus alkaliphilus]|uniref:serine-type D-Ala-D-Ala carboxypeptidase n=2 Tax=Anaerobacillus alkaliphilus TaxID=1548597 RepID=A0A4Q0VRE5_9BACI|nr:penicillin-binding protein [Anaerobacillus alkaliphilus]RXI98721.1 penicillin-binding protein [Anaerobacillus alkaliphilus]
MNIRAVVLLIVFLLLFSLLVGRVGYIQFNKTVNGQELEGIAEDRWTRKYPVEGKRGTIFDRFGDVLAEEIPSYTLVAILDKNSRNRVEDPKLTAEKLAPVVQRNVEDIERILSTGLADGRFQVELGVGTKNLSLETKREIEELQLKGITFRKEPRRYYPKQTFASHVIGYTERDMSRARMGLESSLNEYLDKEDGFIQYLSDRKGIKLPNIEEVIETPQNGFDVFLTIDSNIQMALEQIMSQVEERYEPERMMAIVADPKTGAILAMSNRPSFNPNFYEEITNYTNFTISSRFEPGSTMKMYTLAAAIEEGVYEGSELYQSGSYQIGGRRVRDHNQGLGWGKIPFDEGFQRSSNVAYSILALEKLGPDRLYYYLDRFGFRASTGIDLPNEASSLIADSYRIDAATTAFGQGSAITPIQQIQAATAIANGGKMMKPYIIDRMVNPNTGEVVTKTEPTIVGEPISSTTAKRVLELMESVVTSPAGTGKPYYIEGFEIAGKTGTAEISNPNGPGYLSGHGQYIYSFMGVAPRSNPQLIVYVAVDRPKIEIYEQGSAPVSQIFTSVMKHSLQYLNISPNARATGTQFIDEGSLIEDYVDETTLSAKAELENLGLDVHVMGTGNKIVAQVPRKGTMLLPGEKILFKTNSTTFPMPNITNWSLRDVMKLADLLELNANIIGTGFVREQSILPATEIEIGDYIVIELTLPNQMDVDVSLPVEEEEEDTKIITMD